MTIAIDFGTERTKLAYIDGGQPKMMYLGAGGLAHIPTLFYLGQDGKYLLGDDAAEMLMDDPAGVVTVLKRKMHDPHIRANRQRVAPIELISRMLKTLRERARRELPVFAGRDVERVALTMPALYGPSDRNLMEKACHAAGFQAVDFIPEPVAAARAWAATTGGMSDTVVVFDCGGGTIDWACLHRDGNDFALVPDCPPGGNTRVGGHDVDRDILDYVLDQSRDSGVHNEIKSRVNYYLSEARKMKETYCRSGVIRPFRINSHKIEIWPTEMDRLMRGRFMEQAAQDLAQFVADVQEKLNVASPTVLLVGGSSHVKGLEDLVRERCDVPVARWDQAEYAIALGALRQSRTASTSVPSSFASNMEVSSATLGTLIVETVPSIAPTEEKAIQADAITLAGATVETKASESAIAPSPDQTVNAKMEVTTFIEKHNQEQPAFLLLCEESLRILWRLGDPINQWVFVVNCFFQAQTKQERVQAIRDIGDFYASSKWPTFDTLMDEQGDAFATFVYDWVQSFAEGEISAYPELATWQGRFTPPEAWRSGLKKHWADVCSPMRKQYDSFVHSLTKEIRPDWTRIEQLLLGQSSAVAELGKKSILTAGKLVAAATASIVIGGPLGRGVGVLGWRWAFSDKGDKSDKSKELDKLNSELNSLNEKSIEYCTKMEAMLDKIFSGITPTLLQVYPIYEGLCRDAAARGIDLIEMQQKAISKEREKLDQDSVMGLSLLFENLKQREDISPEIRVQFGIMAKRMGIILREDGLVDEFAFRTEIAIERYEKIKQLLVDATKAGVDWHILDSIPEKKLLGAANGYARDVFSGSILALHDSSFWGGGGSGYLILSKGIACSSAFEKESDTGNTDDPAGVSTAEHSTSYLLPWADIEKCEIMEQDWMLQRTNNRSWVKLSLGYSIKNVAEARKALQELLAIMQNAL